MDTSTSRPAYVVPSCTSWTCSEAARHVRQSRTAASVATGMILYALLRLCCNSRNSTRSGSGRICRPPRDGSTGRSSASLEAAAWGRAAKTLASKSPADQCSTAGYHESITAC